MRRRCLPLILAALPLILASCQQAQQFPALGKKPDAPVDAKPTPEDTDVSRMSWLEPKVTHAVPLVFVAESSAEWKDLPFVWNHYPPLPTSLGLAPLQALASAVLSEHHRVIKIKVPRGLPDPTPNVPATNPPTQSKWRLGKELFFTPFVKTDAKVYSCSTCHDPRRAFAADPGNSSGSKYNPMSLINVAYQRRQFWDGRVQTLEETIFPDGADERATSDAKRMERGLEHHSWAGLVRVLAKEARFSQQFNEVFGTEPTQDAAARALATFMRTLLSGDSLYDRAENLRREKKAPTLTADHFSAVLSENESDLLREVIGSGKPKFAAMPELLIQGHELFHGKARCAQCHAGPLFTDHDFHNIGYRGDEGWPVGGKETGRAGRVPTGLKEARLVGAFRTPSVRNLVGKNTYFHNASRRSLRDVIDFYDIGVMPKGPYVARALKDDGESQRLNLTDQDVDALVIFLRALEGRPLDASLMTP